MNKYLKLVIAVVGFALIIVIANVLYNKLSKDYDTGDGLVTEDVVSSEATETDILDDDSNATVDSGIDTDSTTEGTTTSEDNAESSLAPDFIVLNSSGEEVTLESFFGKHIVLNFWASWCGPCKSEFPEFQTAYEEYGEDIEFLMVNMTDGARETVELAEEFIASEGYTLPVYYDVNQDAAYTYYVYSLPTTYFIDASGNIIAYAQGAIDYDTLKRGIDMITQ